MTADDQPPTQFSRLPSLDGLRGLAAATVVLHHSLLLIPTFADQYFSRSLLIDKGDPAWYLTYTPAHLIWAGSEAVLVFFALSGLVVAFPAMYKKTFSWRGYYPSRIVRLYLPMWAAIIFTLVTMLAFPRHNDADFGEWIPIHRLNYDHKSFFLDMLQLVPIALPANSPLWSLRFELYFSILLPLFVVTARPWPRLIIVKVMFGAVVITLAELTNNATIGYLTVFWMGTAMAASWRELESWGTRIRASRYPSAVWCAISVLALLSLSAPWIIWPWLHVRIENFRGVVALGAVTIIFVAAFAAGARRLLSSGVCAWLGRVSFSVYLIHEPVILAFRFHFPSAPPVLLALAGVTASFIAAEVFYRSVEGPSHLLARRLNKWFSVGQHRRAAVSRTT